MKEKKFDIHDPDWKKSVPEPVFDEKPQYLDLYQRAWELAHDHLLEIPGMPQTPYMDEAFMISDIWIWDTCFMTFFCKYAPDVFPGIETLRNFYGPLHDNVPLPFVTVHDPEPWTGDHDGESVQLRIHIPDNPPLFAWAEYSYSLMTGDRGHLKDLLLEKKYLQRHFDFLENLKEPGFVTKYTRAPSRFVKHPDGYFWEGGRSGMDNTPRGRKGLHAEAERPNNPEMLWVDAIAQQGMSAYFISKIADILGEKVLSEHWNKVYGAFRDKVNLLYWDETDGMYYDIHCRTHEKMKCLTPASFWPLLSKMPSPEKVKRMCECLTDPARLGGNVPWTTLSRSDPDFVPETGEYWRGSLWLPTAYMGIKGLEQYGCFDLANNSARKIVDHMYRTFMEYEPHTIWECYNPNRPEPAYHGKTRVRRNFCGWSALGPISLFLENVIGITGANAFENTLEWHLPSRINGAIGVRNYSFGDCVTDLVIRGGILETNSTAPYLLLLDGKRLSIPSGESRIALP